MARVGLKDEPIRNPDEEALGFNTYARALATFSLQCDTPMTIALQGDWGSGKTSLMHLVAASILEQNPKVQILEFNTWQYSQFDMAENLTVSLLSRFVEEISEKKSSETAKAVLRGFWKLGRAVAVGGASFVGQADLTKTFLNNLEEGGPLVSEDPAGRIMKLKEELTRLVQKRIQEAGVPRIIVFIDDIDRLQPVKAVDLLEALKLFLDLPGCVFVLACDYRIIAQGLRQKFPESEGESRGKSFFDKIIQLPFTMPTTEYSVHSYFEKLLSDMGIEFEADDVQVYADLVTRSVGFNPRTLKRLFNSLMLLRLVVQEDLVDRSSTASTVTEKMKTLFAVRCLQYAFEPAYLYLQRNDLTSELLAELRESSALESDAFDELREELKTECGQSVLQRFCSFMDAFHSAVQLSVNTDMSNMSDDELDSLDEILMLASVISHDAGELTRATREKRRLRNHMLEFIHGLNGKYGTHLKAISHEPRFDFTMARERKDTSVSVSLSWLEGTRSDGVIRFLLDKDEMRVVVDTSNPERGRGVRLWLQGEGACAFPGCEFALREEGSDQALAVVLREGFSPHESAETRFKRFQHTATRILDSFVPKAAGARECIRHLLAEAEKEEAGA